MRPVFEPDHRSPDFCCVVGPFAWAVPGGCAFGGDGGKVSLSPDDQGELSYKCPCRAWGGAGGAGPGRSGPSWLWYGI